MTGWLHARRAGWWAATAVALALVAGLATGRLPSLNVIYRSGEGAPFRLVVPALVATAILSVLISPTPRADRTSTRHPHREIALAAVVTGGCVILAEALPVALGAADAPFTFTRNLLGFVGIGFLTRAFLPATTSPLAPLAWVIPTLTLARPEGDLIAWPLLPSAADPRGLVAAAGLVVLGLTVEIVRTHRIAGFLR